MNSAPHTNQPTGPVPPRRRRRWLPATVVVGGVLGAGVLLASTASATNTVGPASISDDGATATTSTGELPGPGADGSGPLVDGLPVPPPAGGPAGGPVGAPAGPAADGSTAVLGTVAASSDTGITVQTDSGESVSASFTADTRFRSDPPAGDAGSVTAADFGLGKRVDIRVLDGNIVDAGLVVAHVDGTLTALSGGTATVTTRDGLKVTLDLSAITTDAVVGDHVHVRGSVDTTGSTVIASGLEVVSP